MFSRSKALMGYDSHSESSGQTLARLEDKRRPQAASFAECDATSNVRFDTSDDDSPALDFAESCSIVVQAVLSASSSDRFHVAEYRERGLKSFNR